jgi:hypothetical protein
MRTGLLATAALAAMIVAPAAQSAQTLVFDRTSGTFGNANIGFGGFNDTFDIDLAQAGKIALTISSTRTAALNDIDFFEVSLNGWNFTTVASGLNEFRILNDLSLMAGRSTLIVRGRSGGNGSYAGTINFSPSELSGAPGVPEPATWAMMIGGMGAVGYALRRRRALVPA